MCRNRKSVEDRMYRSNRGFSLVELLVVITIIGVLVALIIPGVNMVREQGRQTTCLYNQRQISTAITGYEMAKRHLPGVINLTNKGVANNFPRGAFYTWVEAIFPYLDRSDMFVPISAYDASAGTTYAPLSAMHTMRVQPMICPNDPYLINASAARAQALLSYGVNDNFFNSYVTNSSPPAISNQPLDRNGNPVTAATTSKLVSRASTSYPRGESVSQATTIMLGERTGDDKTNPHATGNGWIDQSWNPSSPTSSLAGNWYSLDWQALTFVWPNPAAAISPNIMVSNHPSKVIVTFFDGHSEKVENDTVYPQ